MQKLRTSMNKKTDIQNKVKNPRNSLVPERSLLMSKWDILGVKVTRARHRFDARERNGLETWMVPSAVLNPPVGEREVTSGVSAGSRAIAANEGRWWWC